MRKMVNLKLLNILKLSEGIKRLRFDKDVEGGITGIIIL